MTDQSTTAPSVPTHGAARLPSVEVESYNVELKDDDGLLGDRASKGAFREILERWRKPLRKAGDDPFGDEPSSEISRKKLDSLLAQGDPEAAGVVQSAVEDFAQELALVIRRFLKLKAWRDTERIVVGGGFRASRPIDLVPIRNDPDEAGLIGAVHLAPRWMFEAHDAIIGVDIGGTNVRAGIVELNLKKASDLSKALVWKFELWRHADEKSVTREETVEELIDMLSRLIARADKEDLRLAPFIGIGCPGVIEADGTITRGAQNLPGNWESKSFHLPRELHAAIPTIGEHETMIVVHNDAVVQGLSEVPFMRDVTRWGVLTIGTGLGNGCFTNRTASGKD